MGVGLNTILSLKNSGRSR
ncbi:hypothetical protein [Klebsiella pneumoniae]